MANPVVKHCGFCGNSHSGDCHPESFKYFECSNCKLLQQLPWDVLAFCGWGNMVCNCGKRAEDSWQSITHEEYKCKVAKTAYSGEQR